MIPKIEYGQKDIHVGYVFEITDWLVHCSYSSAQVLRFILYNGDRELELQKMLLNSMRQPWRILRTNFAFANADAGKEINALFYLLDDYMRPKSRYDRSNVV